MKQLKDLPEDILNLFDGDVDHVVDENNLEEFADNLKEIIRTRFRERQKGEVAV